MYCTKSVYESGPSPKASFTPSQSINRTTIEMLCGTTYNVLFACVCVVIIGHQAHTLAFDFFYHCPGHAVLRKAIDTDNTMKLKKDRRKPLRKTTSTSTSPMEAPRPSTSRRKGLSFSDVGCREQIDQITKCIECELKRVNFTPTIKYTNPGGMYFRSDLWVLINSFQATINQNHPGQFRL